MRLALEDALYILKIQPDPESKNFTQILTRKASIITSVMTALVRIDEMRLRGMQKSRIDKVFDAMKKAQEKNPRSLN